MSNATVLARAARGIDAPLVRVEVHCGPGLPGMSIVGLPAAAVRESKDRVRAALHNTGFDYPAGKVTVNLAPADLPKDGGRFDLPIALGILAATKQLPQAPLERHECLGELSLGGTLRAVRGALPAALAARAAGRALLLPAASAAEAALGAADAVFGAEHLLEACAHLRGVAPLAPAVALSATAGAVEAADLAEVRGQHAARRALEVAAAGAHALLLIGPPGTGKTMLATRLPALLPPLEQAAALESAALRSLGSEGLDPASWRTAPFRAPHHSASAIALCGGSSPPRPGEISLAHHGVLFLDELPEFERRVLEVLREPLETGRIVISRAARQAEFPARFQLVAAMNPCPCGWLGDDSGRCRCTPDLVQRYRARISGPLLDRIDLHCEVPRLAAATAAADAPAGEASAAVAARVAAARGLMLARQGVANARLDAAGLRRHATPDVAGRRLLATAAERALLSARAVGRVLRVARTVADLAGQPTVGAPALAEALAWRALDRPPAG
jgi:magnesium chelatase family protein